MKTIILLGTTFLFLSACSPIYYSPNTHNTPLLSEKGELSINVAGNSDRIETQAAYALDDHFGVMLNNGFYLPRKADNGDGGNGQFFEAGAGYFSKVSDRMIFEVYGLAGYGHVQNKFPSTRSDYPNTSGTIDANIFRFGIQPAIGYKQRYFETIFSTRLLGMNYSAMSGSLVYNNEDQIAYLKNNRNHFLVEPAITLRAGIDILKLQMQIGTSFNLSNPDFRQDQGYATIGLVYRPFAKMFLSSSASNE